MNLSSITSFFKKKKKKLTVPDTILIKKLKSLSSQSNLLVYKDMNIYHHTNVYTIPLMVIDELRGIYLFETKEWTFDELKNADIQKAEHQDSSENTLAFENRQNIIRKKFNELTHDDGVPIFNYLLMENLSADEYEHLNDSFKELLPKEKIIFSDAQDADIFKKLQDASKESDNLLPLEKILTTLFIQHAIIDQGSKFHPASQIQIDFIDNEEFPPIYTLRGVSASGKSNLLLLKSIVEVFSGNSKKIIIIKPTLLACDILKKKLLDIVEHAIIEFDLTAIEILTPLELLNKHQLKLGRESLTTLHIDDKLMKKSFPIADIIMCDDALLYPLEFTEYLKHIQKKSHLIFVHLDNDDTQQINYRFQERKINFYKTNPHAKAMHLIASLIQRSDEKILVVSNSLSREKLKDDLDSFIENDINTLDSSIHLINQKFTNLLLCNYLDTNELQVDHIILMDLCFSSENEIEYAFHLSTKSVNILYEEDCIEIKNLRIKYEQSTQE